MSPVEYEDTSVTEVELSPHTESLENKRDVGIPSLEGKEFHKIGAEPEEDDSEEGFYEADDDDGEEEAASPQPQPFEEPEERPRNPWARNRVLKRERREKEQEVERLSEKLARVERLLENAVSPKKTEKQQEDLTLDDADPVGSIFNAIKQIRNEIQEVKSERVQDYQRETAQDTLKAVNSAIITQATADPVFNAGIQYLSNILERSTARKYPDKSETERLRMAANAINEMKIKWASEGLDPVEQMMELAIDYNFDPYSYAEKMYRTAKPQDAAKKIKDSKERMKGTASLGGSEGSPSRKTTAKTFKGMNETMFSWHVNKMIAAGEARPTNSIGKTPSFSDLLPGKGRPAH